jgi:hypothetical protein
VLADFFPDEIKDDNASKLEARRRGGNTSVRLGVGAMNTKQRSHGDQANSVGTVEE